MSLWNQNTTQALRSKLEIARIVTCILTGVFSREMIRAFRHDWSIIRGRKCCGVTGALLYFLCRHITTGALCMGVLSITRPITGLSSERMAVIAHVRQGMILVANVLAYQILAIRVTAIWRHYLVGWSLYAAMLCLWILNLLASTRVKGVYDDAVMTNVIAAMMTTTMTILLILFILGLLRAHRFQDFPTSHPSTGYQNRSTLYMLYNEGLVYFVICWVFQVMIMTVDYADIDPQRIILAILGLTILVVTVICACRVHQDMVNRSTVSALAHTPNLTVAVPTLIRHDLRPPEPTPTITTSRLQLNRPPSVLSRLTCTTWQSDHTHPTSESIEMSAMRK